MKVETLKLSQVINAAGKLTVLGGSCVSDNIMIAQKYGAQHFFEMEALMEKSGEYVATQVGSESAYIVNSASAGIVQAVAGLIGKGSSYHSQHPYENQNLARDIIIPKGHNIDFGVPLSLLIQQAGGSVREAGYANKCTVAHVTELISNNTAAILYVKSHHSVQKNMLSVEEVVKLAKQNSIPLIIDAAAESDLFRYYKMGADLVIYSGGKAMGGPTSGLIIGRNKYIQWVKKQKNGIGRGMKVGKDTIFGVMQALEDYATRDEKEEVRTMHEKLFQIKKELESLPELTCKIVRDVAGREIYRLRIKLAETIDANKIVHFMKSSSPVIYFREHQLNNNIIDVDVRSVDSDDINSIITKIKAAIKEQKND